MSKGWKAAHPAEVRAYNKLWRQKNSEKEKKRLQKRYQEHKDEILLASKLWHKNNVPRATAATKRWRAKNPDKPRIYATTWNKKNPERVADKKRRERAAKQSATTERFSATEIFERDKWICQLCKRKVNRKLKHPHPLSASLDHIVPLSRGGAHERKNTHLAHLTCNLKAHTGGVKQLLCFG